MSNKIKKTKKNTNTGFKSFFRKKKDLKVGPTPSGRRRRKNQRHEKIKKKSNAKMSKNIKNKATKLKNTKKQHQIQKKNFEKKSNFFESRPYTLRALSGT